MDNSKNYTVQTWRNEGGKIHIRSPRYHDPFSVCGLSFMGDRPREMTPDELRRSWMDICRVCKYSKNAPRLED